MIEVQHDYEKDQLVIRNGDTITRVDKPWGNANPPKRFPRSEKELDTIMMRRVNARLQLEQEKNKRHWKHVAVGALVVVFAPIVIVAVFRLWGVALAWIAA